MPASLRADPNGGKAYLQVDGVDALEVTPNSLAIPVLDPADGDALIFDSATGTWKPGAVSGGGHDGGSITFGPNEGIFLSNDDGLVASITRDGTAADIAVRSDNYIRFYESDAGTLRAEWSMNDGTFNFMGSLQESGNQVYHTGNLHPVAASNGQAEVASSNWNNYTTTGFYMGNGLVNQPAKSGAHSWKYVQVIRHNSSYAVQTAWDFNGVGMWRRTYTSGSWTAWNEIHSGNVISGVDYIEGVAGDREIRITDTNPTFYGHSHGSEIYFRGDNSDNHALVRTGSIDVARALRVQGTLVIPTL